jgi:hypothetical protein
MRSDPIRGQTIRFTFSDGPMAKKTFEHVFDANGTVSFHMVGGAAKPAAAGNAEADASKKTPDPNYEVAVLNEDVAAVSYLGSGGYTLTTLLDFKTKKLVAFSSDEKGVSVQQGTFEAGSRAPARSAAHAHG